MRPRVLHLGVLGPAEGAFMTEHPDPSTLDDKQRAELFAQLVEEYGSTEASRRWMAAFAAQDATET